MGHAAELVRVPAPEPNAGAGAPAAATAVRGRHLPALDGVRALAIGGVVAYHLGWLRGGYLGVDLFFVLSGFLITSLLVEERSARGGIGLAAFWGRRARRLLPALLLLLCVLAAAAAVGAPGLSGLRADALATIAYVANWHALWASQSYFAQFAAPSPLQHTWSLAIEEQFYVLWPLLLLAGFRLIAPAPSSWRSRWSSPSWSWRPPWSSPSSGDAAWRFPFTVATAVAAIASAAWMGWLAAHGASLDRLYYGTDTRAFDLLAGATLAMLNATRPEPAPGARRHALHGASVGGVVVLGVFWATAGGSSGPPRLMFEGGLALCALAAAVVLAGVRLSDPGPLGRLLSVAPLRFVGRISYGLYLWHWPVITELTPARTGITGAPLALVRIAIMTALAWVSFVVVEQPIRHARFSTWPPMARRALAPVAMVVTGAAVVAATVPGAIADVGVRGGLGTLAAQPVPGSGGFQDQSLALGFTPTAARPLRVDLIGDSVMRAQAPAVIAALGATGAATVHDGSFPGWGLSTDPTWPTGMRSLLAATRPDIVVATWSWDDTWLLSNPASYRAALTDFLSFLLEPGGTTPGVAGVLLEEFPPLGPLDVPDQQQRLAGVAAFNALVATMPARFPGRVLYLPVGASVERHGRYAAYLPPVDAPTAPRSAWVRVRSVDNTHFCPAGAARYAAALAADLHQLTGLPDPAPSWLTGAWSRDPAVYDTPPGSCPA